MELEKLQQLLVDPQKLVEKVQALKPKIDYDKLKKQYDPLEHDIIKDTSRFPDKTVNTAKGPKSVAINRISIPFQELIVGCRATFLCGNPIELQASVEKDTIEEKLMQVIRKVWDDNKLDYESKRLAKILMSETDCAELWFSEVVDELYWKGTANEGKSKAKPRVRILANSLGDGLYPVFNNMGDMIAFGRSYTIEEDDEKTEHFDLYFDDHVQVGIKTDNKWEFEKKPHGYKKIPIVYYSQSKSEWYNVQTNIERLEVSMSRHGNANDYFGAPLMVVKGKIQGFAEKGEDGKVLQLEAGAEVNMITWDQAPDSVKLEQERLLDNIYIMSGTPKLSGEDLTAAGNYSGAAMKMRFLPAHMKAADKEETFGKGIQRRLNFLKAAMAVINTDFEAVRQLQIKPRFKFFTPMNEQEAISILVNALTGDKPIISQDTAVDLNPLIEDKEAEKKKLEKEKAETERKQQEMFKGSKGLDDEMNNDESGNPKLNVA